MLLLQAAVLANALRYTPATDFTGTDVFSYTISDGNGGTDDAQVGVDVTGVNDPPLAGDDKRMTSVDEAITILVLANDIDADDDPLELFGVQDPANGSVQVDGDSIIYQPRDGFIGVETFEYKVRDGNDGEDSALVTVDVSGLTLTAPPANEQPPADTFQYYLPVIGR